MSLVKMTTVEEEMKRNPEFTKSDLDTIKDWLKKQHHLPAMSDAELILFLHSNHFRIESTKTTIDTFFTVRTHVPEFFSGRDPLSSKELREVMKLVGWIQLPTPTPEGHKVILSNLLDANPSNFVFADAIKLLFIIMELHLYTEGTCPGYIIVIDMKGATFGHVARLNPIIMKKFLYYLQEGIPIRLQSMHFMNAIPLVDTVLNLAKPFMKKELIEQLYVHPTATTLSQKIPIDLLPNEQGGKAGPLKDLWAAQVNEIEKHRAWYQEEETRTVNESLRPGKAMNATHIFGVEGSFKKLDID